MLALHPMRKTSALFKKMLLYSFLVSIPVLLWQLWVWTVPAKTWYWTNSLTNYFILRNPYDPSSPLASFSDWIVRMRQNMVWGMTSNIATALVAPFYFLEGGYWGFFLSIPIVIGLMNEWWKSLRHEPSVLEGFTLFGLALLWIYYDGQASRYMALLYPHSLFMVSVSWPPSKALFFAASYPKPSSHCPSPSRPGPRLTSGRIPMEPRE